MGKISSDAGKWNVARMVMGVMLVVGLALGVAGCSTEDAANLLPNPSGATFIISGMAIDSGGGPIAGVSVQVSGPATVNTTTDSGGQYSVSNLPPGSYIITASKTGVTFDVSTKYATLGPNQTINFVGAVASFSISGTILLDTDGDGAGDTPLSGATVSLSGMSGGTTTTNGSGVYTFAGLVPGSYTITPSKTSHVFTPASINVDIANANKTGINFTAVQKFIVSGTVLDTGSSPLAGVDITIPDEGSAATDGSGNYSFELTSGTYVLSVGTYSGYTFSPLSIVVTVSGADSTGNDFTGTAFAGNAYYISGGIGFDTDSNGSSNIALSGITVTISGDAAGVAVTGADGMYTFNNLPENGSYTVTPTPRAGHAFTQANQTINPLAGNTGANFVAQGPCYTVGGHVSAEGWQLANVDVHANTDPVINALTDGSGNYTLDCLPNGTYTFTPYYASPSWFFPQTQSVTISGSNVNGVDFGAAVGMQVSGDITYSGSKSGWVYVNLSQGGWDAPYGTAVNFNGSGIKSYTIRGVRPGNYTVKAYMDDLGEGAQTSASPLGQYGGNVDVSASDATLVDFTIADPTPDAPMTSHVSRVIPGDNSALVFYGTPRNGSDVEIAQSYKIYYGTNPSLTPANADASFSVTAIGDNDDGIAFVSGLPNGSTYYFIVGAVSGGAEASTSAATGATIGAPTGNNTVSGTLTLPPAAVGTRALVGLYSETQGIFFDMFASAQASQSFSITGVPSGTYERFVLVDMDASGHNNSADLFSLPGMLAISGNQSGLALSLAPDDADFAVTTKNRHNASGGSSYSIDMRAEGLAKRPVAVTMSGTYLPGNVDVIKRGGDEFALWQDLSGQMPQAGEHLYAAVTFSDGSTTDMTATIPSLLNAFATPTYPLVTDSGDTSPMFTWAAPVSPPADYMYTVYIYDNSGGGSIWEDWGMSSSTLSTRYNNDGRASQSLLTVGTSYTWVLGVMDAEGNRAEVETNYTP